MSIIVIAINESIFWYRLLNYLSSLTNAATSVTVGVRNETLVVTVNFFNNNEKWLVVVWTLCKRVYFSSYSWLQ